MMIRGLLRDEEIDFKISRDEIIKRFDLPERKSKINTILKLQQEQEQPLYCLCQSSDISKFMIGCEKCDEWYHGDCIGFEETDALQIKKWYCFDCIKKYGLKIVYFSDDFKNSSSKKNKEKRHRSREIFPYLRGSGHRCGRCSNCLQNEECGNKDYQSLSDRSSSVEHDTESDDLNQTNNNSINSTNNNSVDEQDNKSEEDSRMREDEESAKDKPQHCIGINCTNACREKSKYCSEECGLELAKLRLRKIIPQHLGACLKIGPSQAQDLDSTELNEIGLQKVNAFEELRRLDVKEKELMNMIERSKTLPIIDLGNNTKQDTKLCCVTCGWDVPSQSLMKHMETCFRKVENHTAIDAPTKSNSEFCRIFCDQYNPVKRTYCMRLRYVCPEHFKPKKVEDNEVCGCPIVKPLSSSNFSDIEKFCQKPKKICSQHWNWDILAISDIDLERQRVWANLSRLVARETIITKQMGNRAGALGYLLHSTTIN